jgi:hypothetical protein
MSNATETKPVPSNEILSLTQAVKSLPGEYQQLLAPIVAKVAETHNRRQRLNKLIQEALSQLRLDIKYLEFDLQATRNERNEYKEELERYEDFE